MRFWTKEVEKRISHIVRIQNIFLMNHNFNNKVNVYDQLDVCGKGKMGTNLRIALTAIGNVRDKKIWDECVQFSFWTWSLRYLHDI